MTLLGLIQEPLTQIKDILSASIMLSILLYLVHDRMQHQDILEKMHSGVCVCARTRACVWDDIDFTEGEKAQELSLKHTICTQPETLSCPPKLNSKSFLSARTNVRMADSVVGCWDDLFFFDDI